MTPLQTIFEERAAFHGHKDMLPHMHQLKQLAASCRTATEFGIRTGQSTIVPITSAKAGAGLSGPASGWV